MAFVCKAVSIFLKLKGQRGYKECLPLGPAVHIWPRVLVSERWPNDIGDQPVASGGGRFPTSLWVLFGNLGCQSQLVAQVCGLCLVAVTAFR